MQATDRRRSSSRRLEDLYRRSIEDLKDYAIFMVDPENRVISWNIGAERILGYPEEEVLGRSASIFSLPEDREQGKDQIELELALSHGRAEDERWHVKKDGGLFYASGIITPVRDDSGGLVGFAWVLRDVTRQKRQEEERDRFFTVSIDMLCIAAVEGHLKRVNPSFSKVLGYSSEELLNSPLLHFIHPDDKGALQAEYIKLASGIPITYLENRVHCKDGSYKWVGWTFFPIPDDGIAYGTGRDVTVRRQLEDVLTNRADELEQANRIKDEFLAMLSHELRTPLTAMLGWLHLLRNGQVGEAGYDHALEIIERNAKSQAKLIEDLLDVSRIMTGKLRVELQPVALAPSIESGVNALLPMVKAKKLELNCAIDPDAGMVMGDPHRLRQIVTNLLSNAIKFTPVGGRIYVKLERSETSARLVVSDTGVGINEDVLPFIFERFRQADSSDRREYGGLGLGLAIVRHLVDRHGGTVSVHSEGEGKGATFTVELPLSDVESDETDMESKSTLLKQGKIISESDGLFDDPCALEKVHVLLVEDEKDTREMVKKLLEACGAHVTAIASADEAMSKIRTAHPDILISDIGMQGTNGYELIRQIRRLKPEEGGLVPGIALTAYAGPRDRKRALRAGYQAHLAKPIDPDELLIVVASLAWQSGTHASR